MEHQLSLRIGDVRDEAALSNGISLTNDLSPNLQKVLASLEDGKLKGLGELADKIEAGRATGEEDEENAIYEGFVELFNHVHDLAHMCRRREEALTRHGVRFGRLGA